MALAPWNGHHGLPIFAIVLPASAAPAHAGWFPASERSTWAVGTCGATLIGLGPSNLRPNAVWLSLKNTRSSVGMIRNPYRFTMSSQRRKWVVGGCGRVHGHDIPTNTIQFNSGMYTSKKCTYQTTPNHKTGFSSCRPGKTWSQKIIGILNHSCS